MNKIYYLFVDEYDYDEYDAFVIIAKKRSRAIYVLKDKKEYLSDNWNGKIHIQFIGYSHLKEQIIIDSFNAG